MAASTSTKNAPRYDLATREVLIPPRVAMAYAAAFAQLIKSLFIVYVF